MARWTGPSTLAEVGYGPNGQMDYPRRRGQAGEEAFPGYLDEGPTGLPPDFEALRWFSLPPACLESRWAE
jgi:hypothetical protein